MLAAALAVLACVCEVRAQPAPARIVSLDLCTDQLLVELVDRSRIAAVTHLLGDVSVSAIPEKARGLRITHGGAEDVLRYDPDLVLAGPYGVSATVSLLRRLGRNVVVVPQPPDLDGVRASVRVVAAAIGEQPKGEALIAEFDRRLSRLAPPAGPPPTAVIYQIGGTVSGPGSLANAALAAAGFRNMSADYRLTRGGQVPLEIAGRPAAGSVGAGQQYRGVPHGTGRQPAPSRHPPAAPARRLPRAALAPVVVRHPARRRCDRAAGRGAGRHRGAPAMTPISGRPDVKPMHLLVALGLAAAVAFALSLSVGPSGIGIDATGEARVLIFNEIRLPRAVLGALVGGALGLSGAALQGYLRNPLAEPSLVGVSGGAALGAVLAIHLGLSQAFALALPLGGLAGAAIAMLAVVALAGAHGGPVTLILAGLAVSSIATALVSLALNLSQNPFAAVEMVFWMMGSLADRSLTQLWISAPLVLVGIALLLTVGRALDALTLGEDAAGNLGIDLGRTRLAVIAGTALSVGAATAVTGIIGFVGLIVPHMLRPLAGHRPGLLLPASALGGATMLLAADVALRLVQPWIELRIGVLTALIGAPFFVWLVLRTRAELAP